MLIYRLYKKMSRIQNASKFHILDSNSNQRLILDFRCASKSILFSYVEFCEQGGSSKWLIFKWLAQNFNLKMNFFFHCQQMWNGVINL